MKRKALSIIVLLLFSVILIACGKKPTEEQTAAFERMVQAIEIGVPEAERSSVANSFSVPVTGREEGSVVTWTTDKEAFAKFETTGGQDIIKVTRPAVGQPNELVVVTATIKWTTPKGYEFSETKTFSIRILATPESKLLELTDIRKGEFTEGGIVTKLSVGDNIAADDVTVVHVAGNGFSIFDGTTSMFVYGSQAAAQVKVGDKGNIIGKYGVNFDSPQMTDATFTKESEVTLEALLATAIEKDVKDFWIEPYDKANDPDGAGAASEVAGKISPELNTFVKLQVKVVDERSWNSSNQYTIMLYDTSEGSTDKFVRSYYGGMKHDEIAALTGQTGYVYAVPYTIRNDRPQPSTITNSLPTFEFFIVAYDFVLTDQNKVDIDKLNTKVTTEFEEDGIIELPTSGSQGSVITWSYKNANDPNKDLVNLETGEVTTVENDQRQVVLVATYKLNDTTSTKEFTITIGKPIEHEILSFRDTVDGGVVGIVEGLVTYSLYSADFKNWTFYIQDDTAGILSYRVSGSYDNIIKVGNVVRITGSKSYNGGLGQFTNATVQDIELVEENQTVTPTPLTSQTDLKAANVAKLVSMEGVLTAGSSDRDYTITKGSFSVAVRLDAGIDLSALANKYVGITAALMTYNGNYQIAIHEANQVVEKQAGDADLVAMDKAALQLASTTFEAAGTLVLPTAGANGSAISWDYKDQNDANKGLLNLTNGAVTLPASGQVELKIVATLTKGTVTETKEFTLFIGSTSLMTIADAKTKAAETPVVISGVLVEGDARDVFYVHDASGVMPLVTSDTTLQTTLKALFGKQVEISGKIGAGTAGQSTSFLHVKDFTVSDKGAAVDAPIKVTLPNLEDATLIEHLGKLVSYNGLVVKTISSNFSTVTFENTTLTIYIRTTLVDPAVKAYVEALQIGDIINIKDITLGQGYDVGRLHFNNLDQISKATLTDEQKVAIDKNALLDTIPVTSAGTIDLVALGQNGSTITWAFKNSEDTNNSLIDLVTKAVTMPASSLDVVLVATIKSGSAQDTLDVTVSFFAELPTIATVKGMPVGSIVTVEGVLTSYGNNNYYFIADATGAIALDVYTLSLDDKALLLASVGKTITLTGERAVNNGLVEIEKISEFEVGTEATMPDALVLDEIALNAATLLEHQSKIVTLNDVTVANIARDTYGTVTFNAVKDDETFIMVRWDNRVTLPTELKAVLDGLVDGKVISLENLVLGWYNNPQLMIYAGTTIEEAELTDADKAAIALDALTLPSEGNVTSNLTLPTTGLYGAVITWTASEGQTSVVIADGVATVTRGEEDVAVTLTYSLVVGEITLTDDIEVVVVKLSDENGEEQLLVTYDFSTIVKGNEYSDATFKTDLLSSDGDSTLNPIVTNTTKVYAGNGTGGSPYENVGGLVKVGTGSVAGKFTLEFSGENITKVVITFASWNNDTVSVNGSDGQKSTTKLVPEELVFVLEGTDTVTFDFNLRGLIFKIEIYTTN